MGFPASELRAVNDVEPEALKVVKLLSGPKTGGSSGRVCLPRKSPAGSAGLYSRRISTTGRLSAKIKDVLQQVETASPGAAGRGHGTRSCSGWSADPKFDKVVEDFFQLQLLGRARKPEDHAKILRKLAGIKEAPKKIEEKKKPEKPKKKGELPSKPEAAATGPVTPPKIEPHRMAPKKSSHAPAPAPKSKKKKK